MRKELKNDVVVKSYTDISQSKKLAEILPLESADMYFYDKDTFTGALSAFNGGVLIRDSNNEFPNKTTPAWSLAALQEVVKTYSSRLEIILRADKKYNIFAVSGDFVFRSFDDFPDGFDTPVDACYETIIKLHELKKL